MQIYTGLNFNEIDELDEFSFLAYARDAIVWELEQTDAGKEMLEEAWALEDETGRKPDEKQINELKGVINFVN